ncbi:acyltransferase family protein [Pedobacter frigiditerrae]|uniref:acyltransferase family protein n=1 Tax=Pedobacter frigiditerrae TaxID=2530452 RepID=UPI00292DC429|nr:acyltransferase family protein [Pedobacter frigiditerrae]
MPRSKNLAVPHQKSDFRFDINALRAVAVVVVVFFHFKIPYFDGGFAGVDIFFVISGYLMTKIVINGMNAHKFSVAGFYGRRAQRIVPALLMSVTAMLLAGFFIYFPDEFHSLTKNALGSLLFYSNFNYYNTNYFDASSETNPFLHTWSLSVEWQFYLLLPIILVLVNKIFKNDKRKFLIFFSTTTFLLFLLSIYVTKDHYSAGFYLLPFRAWEMLAGGTAFLLSGVYKLKHNILISILGYVVLFTSLYFLDNQEIWPSLFTLLPVLSTVVIILANSNDYKFLKLRGIQIIGKISYSLYLWHWPLYVVANYFGFQMSPSVTLLLIAISFALAAFSYKYIENSSYNTTRNISIATAVIASISIVLFFNDFNKLRLKKETLYIANYKEDHMDQIKKQFSRGICFKQDNKDIFNYGECLTLSKNEKNILLIGDSHAAHLSESLREIFEKRNIHLLQASGGSCLPTIKKRKSQCNEIFNEIFYKYIPSNATEIDGIILSGNWIAENHKTMVVDLKQTISYLKNFGIPVVIVGQNENYKIAYPTLAAREHELSANISSEYITPQSITTNDILKNNFSNVYIDIFSINNDHKLSVDYIPYIIDENHFSKYGADIVVNTIVKNKIFSNFLQ